MTYPRSIYEPLIEDAEGIRDQLLNQALIVQASIQMVKKARAAAKEAQDALAAAEAEYVTEAIARAESGDGPLAGIARTSKAFGYALDNLLNVARQNGLNYRAEIARAAQMDLMNAEIAYEQDMTKFSALRHAADLQAAMIHGTRV
jgi:hypothetical protein